MKREKVLPSPLVEAYQLSRLSAIFPQSAVLSSTDDLFPFIHLFLASFTGH